MRPATGGVAVDLTCRQCRYNLRGVQQAGNCPECGTPVRETLSGVAPAEGRREAAADALRSFARSYLSAIPLGLFMVGCLGPPIAVLSIVGSVARIVALRHLAAAEGVGLDAADLRRARALAIAEIAVGVPAILMLVQGLAWAIGPTADDVLRLALAGLWFGTMVLGAIAASMLLERTGAGLPVELDPHAVVHALLLGSAPVVVLGMVLGAAGLPAALVILVRLAGAAAWGVGATMLAFRGTLVADEFGALPAPRREGAAKGPSEPADLAARAQVRRVHEDDSPIPLD